MKPLVQLLDGVVQYNRKVVLNRVSIAIKADSTMALIGESGSGKSTLGKALLGLVPLHSGSLQFNGEEMRQFTQDHRKRGQMIFQDSYSFLNPLMRVRDIVMEPLLIHRLCSKNKRLDIVIDLLDSVGLGAAFMDRFPSQLSGGQRQRIGIARALAIKPQFLILDEPFSALDIETHDRMIELLQKLKEEIKMSYLLISHDLFSVESLADEVAVIYQGEIVESGATSLILKNPLHPYTQALCSAATIPDPKIERSKKKLLLKGEISAEIPKKGCPLFARCPMSQPYCAEHKPLLRLKNERFIACHLPYL
ncbi:MAG TPA: ABC transporter ATP-binding protein [Waddliaceae bacterium]